MSTLPFDVINNYDKPFFPDDRARFLRCWLKQPQSTALGILQNGQLVGYGVIRLCRSGYKIGPLLADTPELADHLFSALKASVPNSVPIFLDIPAINEAAVNLVKRHNMIAAFETARMYKGKSPTLPIDRLFGVTSFELG